MRYLDGLEPAAAAALPEAVHRYVAQGAGAGRTTAAAEAAWDAARLVPRVLRDVTDVDLTTTLLGTTVRSPWAVAPTTLHRALHPGGEAATARGTARAGGLLVLSSNAGTRFAEVAATGVAWWLQVYVTADRTLTERVVQDAVDAGAGALVLTADTPVVAHKQPGPDGREVWDNVEADWVRVNVPGGAEGPGAEKATDLGPQDVAWLADRFGLPVVVKGVLHPADARRCVDAGAAAVWVSNHGGRQLDQAVATAEVLPDVVAAVGADAEVYVDGGLRRGVHALVAAAHGAAAVFLGRPVLWALADAGADGVTRLLEELTAELAEACRLAGVTRPRAAAGAGILRIPAVRGATPSRPGLS